VRPGWSSIAPGQSGAGSQDRAKSIIDAEHDRGQGQRWQRALNGFQPAVIPSTAILADAQPGSTWRPGSASPWVNPPQTHDPIRAGPHSRGVAGPGSRKRGARSSGRPARVAIAQCLAGGGGPSRPCRGARTSPPGPWEPPDRSGELSGVQVINGRRRSRAGRRGRPPRCRGDRAVRAGTPGVPEPCRRSASPPR